MKAAIMKSSLSSETLAPVACSHKLSIGQSMCQLPEGWVPVNTDMEVGFKMVRGMLMSSFPKYILILISSTCFRLLDRGS